MCNIGWEGKGSDVLGSVTQSSELNHIAKMNCRTYEVFKLLGDPTLANTHARVPQLKIYPLSGEMTRG